MKIALQKAKIEGYKAPGSEELRIPFALPYFKNLGSGYIHRVRSGTVFLDKGEYSHHAFKYWCGGIGFLHSKKKRGQLLHEVPQGEYLCAVCEGKAIGAGMNGSRQINGREVLYTPKR